MHNYCLHLGLIFSILNIAGNCAPTDTIDLDDNWGQIFGIYDHPDFDHELFYLHSPGSKAEFYSKQNSNVRPITKKRPKAPKPKVARLPDVSQVTTYPPHFAKIMKVPTKILSEEKTKASLKQLLSTVWNIAERWKQSLLQPAPMTDKRQRNRQTKFSALAYYSLSTAHLVFFAFFWVLLPYAYLTTCGYDTTAYNQQLLPPQLIPFLQGIGWPLLLEFLHWFRREYTDLNQVYGKSKFSRRILWLGSLVTAMSVAFALKPMADKFLCPVQADYQESLEHIDHNFLPLLSYCKMVDEVGTVDCWLAPGVTSSHLPPGAAARVSQFPDEILKSLMEKEEYARYQRYLQSLIR